MASSGKQKNGKQKAAPAPTRIADPRFASFETDPRFRLPSKKKSKTTIGKRFSHVFSDKDFTATAKVDRYGRKLKSDSKKKALERLYQNDGEEVKDEGGAKDGQESGKSVEVDDDDFVQRELRATHNKYDPARGGGYSSSESDSDSDAEDGGDDAEAQSLTEGDMQKLQDEQTEVEAGEVTRRIAVVNLDWDHIKSTDLMALFSSFLPQSGGKIEKISVLPSEFGKERMQQEEVDGPPKALFKSQREESPENDSEDDSDADSDEEIKKELIQEGNDQDFDSDALRRYQLDRLRYYYAVVVCSDSKTAQTIYDATDGTEFQSSSNFLDLRFVPDDVDFDDDPRDECSRLSDSYKPIEFVTNALQSSKVKLTWDMHPEEFSRKDSIKRAFTGSRAQLEENDLNTYLASDSEDGVSDEEIIEGLVEEDGIEDGTEEAPKLSKQELARKKMRDALGLTDQPSSRRSKKGPVGDMQITFAPALAEDDEKAEMKEETTIEKYKRKEKERKEVKRQKAREKREEPVPEAAASSSEEDAADDLGFDDPFFTADGPAPTSKTSIRKAERVQKREARQAAEAVSEEQKAQLTKVMSENAAGENSGSVLPSEHFDINEIMRVEKNKRKKGKYAKKELKQTRGGLQEDFKMGGDERFTAVFDNHDFAIDPSDPKFKATEGMEQVLEQGRKRRLGLDEEPREKKAKKKARQ